MHAMTKEEREDFNRDVMLSNMDLLRKNPWLKNKAEVLSEIERMSRLKAEMIDNITQLKGDLEKERTKSAEMKKQNKSAPKQPAKKMPKKKSK